MTPLILLGLLIAPAYGIIRPLHGVKLYASLERSAYAGGYHRFRFCPCCENVQSCLFALCFQPESNTHLFGGDGNNANSW